jgi:hypothetical protein
VVEQGISTPDRVQGDKPVHRVTVQRERDCTLPPSRERIVDVLAIRVSVGDAGTTPRIRSQVPIPCAKSPAPKAELGSDLAHRDRRLWLSIDPSFISEAVLEPGHVYHLIELLTQATTEACRYQQGGAG